MKSDGGFAYTGHGGTISDGVVVGDTLRGNTVGSAAIVTTPWADPAYMWIGGGLRWSDGAGSSGTGSISTDALDFRVTSAGETLVVAAMDTWFAEVTWLGTIRLVDLR